VTDTVGSVSSRTTVIVSMPMLLARSNAVTVIVLAPTASGIELALQDEVPVAVPDCEVAAFDQSTRFSPTLSKASPPSVTEPAVVGYVALLVGEVIVTDGPTVSRVTVIVSVEVFPAVSVAVTVIVFLPNSSESTEMGALSEIELSLQVVVPVAVPDVELVEFVHVTLATATLSEAVPLRATDELDVTYGSSAGEVMVTAGFVLSRVTVIVSVPVLPTASVAVTVIVLEPATSGIELALQEVVPVAGAGEVVPEAFVTLHRTFAMPVSSDAVPSSETDESPVV
jgi:hypothetical protein